MFQSIGLSSDPSFWPWPCSQHQLTYLCPRKDYWADFYNFLHMNPSDDQMKKLNRISSKSERFELFTLCRYIFVPPGINGLNSNFWLLHQLVTIVLWGGWNLIEGEVQQNQNLKPVQKLAIILCICISSPYRFLKDGLRNWILTEYQWCP